VGTNRFAGNRSGGGPVGHSSAPPAGQTAGSTAGTTAGTTADTAGAAEDALGCEEKGATVVTITSETADIAAGATACTTGGATGCAKGGTTAGASAGAPPATSDVVKGRVCPGVTIGEATTDAPFAGTTAGARAGAAGATIGGTAGAKAGATIGCTAGAEACGNGEAGEATTDAPFAGTVGATAGPAGATIWGTAGAEAGEMGGTADDVRESGAPAGASDVGKTRMILGVTSGEQPTDNPFAGTACVASCAAAPAAGLNNFDAGLDLGANAVPCDPEEGASGTEANSTCTGMETECAERGCLIGTNPAALQPDPSCCP